MTLIHSRQLRHRFRALQIGPPKQQTPLWHDSRSLPVIAAVGKDQLVIDLLSMALIMLVFQFVGLIVYGLIASLTSVYETIPL